MEKQKVWLVVLCFVMILTGFRFAWLYAYNHPDMPKAEKGVVDAAKTDLSERPVLLDGEWAFYPEQLVGPNDLSLKKAKWLRVPSDWREKIRNEHGDPYGYGTFHLRILTGQNERETYRIRFMGIDSASRVFVNGQMVKEVGRLGTNESSSNPKNAPFSVNAKAVDGRIDLVIHVSNFHFPRSGGISNAVYFGTREAVKQHEQITMSMQLIAFAVLFFHGIYLVILYILVFKKRNLLLFAAAVFCMSFSILIDDDQLIRFVVPDIGFETWLKLIYLLYSCASISSFYFLKSLVPDQFNKTFRVFQLFAAAYIGSLVVFSYQDFYRFGTVIFSLVMLVPTFLFPFLFYKMLSRKEPYAVYLIFTVIAVSSSTLWGVIKHFVSGMAVPYYPFDLLIGVICFALFWFKRFYHTAEEKTQLNEKLQRADKTKDDFLANTSHELRNPLHAMMNIAQSLLSNPLPEETKCQVQMMESVARKMSYTLQDLTDISALKEGHIHLTKQPVALYSLVEYVFDVLTFSKEGMPIDFDNQIPDAFPLVDADENRLVQILFNFIQNALKFTEKGTVSVSAHEQDGQAFISVQDTGIGMDKEIQKRVFQPYEQADSSIKSTGSGIGLGLSICAQLIELHGGTLSVSSSLGKGSIFTFSLPLSRKRGQTSIMEVKKERPAAFIPKPSVVKVTESILLIDDDPVNISILKRMLEQEGYAVTSCLNGEEALRRLYDKKWSLVISDVMMPRMSGYELTTRIREKFSISELPILLLTARGKIEDIQVGFQVGSNDYVLKPVEKAELMARVSALLQLKQSLQKQARTEAALLQAQMQPHFLYNTLNTIAALSEIDPDEMTKLLLEFGNYLQKSFERGNLQETVTIESELNLVQSYLYIEQQRFGERLSICLSVEDDSLHASVPPLSIQTLVENAVRHGMAARTSLLTISLLVSKTKDGIQVVIKDDGAGMDHEKIKTVLSGAERSGIGLYNTNKRLSQLYGRGLTIQSTRGSGTKVSFLLPIVQNGN